VKEGFSNIRLIGYLTKLYSSSDSSSSFLGIGISYLAINVKRLGFRDFDFLRSKFTKVGSEIRVFQDLLTHLNRTRDFTGRYESTSAMRSSERTASDGVIVMVGCDGGDGLNDSGQRKSGILVV
jgi:hypothetical protein